MASASQSSISQLLSNAITEKHDDSKYFRWKQHVEPVIKVNKLQRFVVNPVVMPRYLIEEDCKLDCVNPKYEAWEFSRPNVTLASIYFL
ncbi:hypothetical protein Fmac_029079 [Flemingia macrophylla]|uniref:Uncharacterized protein n=1 Tax=Flemingia macrophylla TaxID=520843 RepID=A0ABD1L9D0_9FABA